MSNLQAPFSQASMRPRGRPRRSASGVRCAHIALRLTPDERAMIELQASTRGMTLSAYLHACAMRGLHVPIAAPVAAPIAAPVAANENTPPALQAGAQIDAQIDAQRFELTRQLRAIGVNLNQIAKHANTTGILAYDRLGADLPDLAALLKLVDEQLERLL